MKKIFLLAMLLATFSIRLTAQPELYGVAQTGGTSGVGTLFKFDANSTVLQVKKNFNAGTGGAYPFGKLLYASNGKLYGLTNSGGTYGFGTLFEYDPGTETFATKVNFDYSSQGAYSHGHLIQADNDDIIGTSSSGGIYGQGTLWKYDIATNTITKLKDFSYSTTGAHPYNGVMQASNGKLYGMLYYGGANGYGSIYEFDPDGNTFAIVHSFNYSTGGYVLGRLLEIEGMLYGTAYQGGPGGYGTLFKFDFETHALTTLISFDYTSLGAYPYTAIAEEGGRLYGTTINGGQFGYGTLYSFDLASGQTSVLHNFNYATDGYAYNPLTVASDGNLYAMTYVGAGNQGSIYKFDLSSATYTTLRALDYSTGYNPYWSELNDLDASGNPACRSLKILKTSTNVSCNGLTDGAIDITVTGAAADYTIQWSNGATTEDISGLAPGTYSVTVTVDDENECTSRKSIIITQPAPLSAPVNVKKVSFNGTSDGSVSLSPGGGTAPYTFLWSTGATTQNLSNVGVGIYTVEITDANGCVLSVSAEVTKRLTAQTDLYGVTQRGGSFGNGTIFKLDYSTNTLEAKHHFNDWLNGNYPFGALLYADDGMLYGTTVSGGSDGVGVLFRYDPSAGVYSKKFEFDYSSTGANPYGQLIQSTNGDIYGTCAGGGAMASGVLWKYDITTNSLIKLSDFNSQTGTFPYHGVMEASNGKLYGTALQGGSHNYGTLYEWDPQTSTLTAKANFDYTNGAYGNSKLVEVDGKLFGIAQQGGVHGVGTIFEYDLSTETFTPRFHFDGIKGAYPFGGMTMNSNGLLYGVAAGGGDVGFGTLYSFDHQSRRVEVVHNFNYNTDGYPYNPVMQASDGSMYGLLYAGANHTGGLYSFDAFTNSFDLLHTFNYTLEGAYPYFTALTEIGDKIADPCLADAEAPFVITKNLTVELDAHGVASIVPADIDNGSTDNCTIASYALDVSNFGCSHTGANTVTLTVTDEKGNTSSATATVTVVDVIAPALSSVPSDIFLSACLSSASWQEPVATDNCTVTVVRNGPAPGSTFATGSSTTITYTATDASGNEVSGSFVVRRASALAAVAYATPILCYGGTSTVTVNASGGSEPYSGVGSFNVAAGGMHTFTVTDADGCTATTTVEVTQPTMLFSTISTNNASLYFGYSGDQTATITATPTGGIAPYTVSITMVNGEGASDTRVLLCNSAGANETWTGGPNTNTTINTCGVKPVSTSNNNIGTGGSYSVTVALLADARFVATVTDANGCSYTIQYAHGVRVDAEDVRCFAGNSDAQKVQICHNTGNSKSPCVAICVDEASVSDHIAHGDYYGSCTATCTAPLSNARIAATEGEMDPNHDGAMEAYPNPFNSSISVVVSNPDNAPVDIQMIDVIGRNMTLTVSHPSDDGVHQVEPDNAQPGLYLLRVNIGGKYTRTIKLKKE